MFNHFTNGRRTVFEERITVSLFLGSYYDPIVMHVSLTLLQVLHGAKQPHLPDFV